MALGRIGSSFGDELRAAGLGDLLFTPPPNRRDAILTWDRDGTLAGREHLTAEQNATLDAVFAAHVPTD